MKHHTRSSSYLEALREQKASSPRYAPVTGESGRVWTAPRAAWLRGTRIESIVASEIGLGAPS
jgi:hypothetical protein